MPIEFDAFTYLDTLVKTVPGARLHIVEHPESHFWTATIDWSIEEDVDHIQGFDGAGMTQREAVASLARNVHAGLEAQRDDPPRAAAGEGEVDE